METAISAYTAPFCNTVTAMDWVPWVVSISQPRK